MTYETETTAFGYTVTTAGPIQHYPCELGEHRIMAPVVLWPRLKGDGTRLAPRKTPCGTKYLHALPGGGHIAGVRVYGK